MKTLSPVHIEINYIISERKLHALLTNSVPQAAYRTYIFGEVLIFSEKLKKWVVPLIVYYVHGITITFQTIGGIELRLLMPSR